MKKTLVTVIALGALLWGVPSASAHAILTNSNPIAKSMVSDLPAKIWLEFDGNLTDIPHMNLNRIQLSDSTGRAIPITKSYVGGARITAELGKARPTGKVTIAWRVVSEDGHPVTGSIYFYVIPKKK